MTRLCRANVPPVLVGARKTQTLTRGFHFARAWSDPIASDHAPQTSAALGDDGFFIGFSVPLELPVLQVHLPLESIGD